MGARFVELAGKSDGIPNYVPESIGTGRKTVSIMGTRVQLASSQTIGGVIIVAEFGNGGVICVGDNNVIADAATRRGVPLNPGDAVILNIDNIDKIWIDSTINGDGVTYTLVQ